MSDLEHIHEYAKQENFAQYQNWGPNTIEDTRKFITDSIQSINDTPRLKYEFCIVLKQNNKPVGGCGIFIEQHDHSEAKIGYALNPIYWNKGYITETMKQLLLFAKKDLSINTIRATCDKRNIASKRVLEKTGFILEKEIEHDFRQKGRMRDSLVFLLPQ